ncbi:MAG: sulfite reductase [Myxococcales bacterium]|nr:sulfite reductase [Myxococcales bacterium]
MVGPGTGIAPFRAFLEEREARRAEGYSWLIFGARSSATDFLYREQIAAWQASGVLTRFDAAFSRDQGRKVYVQDRMREHGADLFAWLEAGSCFYVCGDAARMARDVNEALLEIISVYGGYDRAGAEAYLARMQAEGRYLRDVY